MLYVMSNLYDAFSVEPWEVLSYVQWRIQHGVYGVSSPTTGVVTVGAPTNFFVIHPLEEGAIVLYSLFSLSFYPFLDPPLVM